MHRHGRLAHRQLAPVDIDQSVVAGRQRLLKAGAGREVDVEVERQGARPLHGARHALAGTGDDPHGHTRAGPFGDLPGRDVAVAGGLHLVGSGQVEPKLKALHQAFLLLGQLAVDHAPAGGHPLHPAVAEQALVAGRVAVPQAAGDHVGDGLETPVRMVRKAGDVVARLVGTKSVQHQERVKPALQVLRQHPRELDARAVAGGLAGDQALDPARCADRRDRACGAGGDRGGGRGGEGVHHRMVARQPPLGMVPF